MDVNFKTWRETLPSANYSMSNKSWIICWSFGLCTFIWIFRYFSWVNRFPHSEQVIPTLWLLNGSWLLCILVCFINLITEGKASEQITFIYSTRFSMPQQGITSTKCLETNITLMFKTNIVIAVFFKLMSLTVLLTTVNLADFTVNLLVNYLMFLQFELIFKLFTTFITK